MGKEFDSNEIRNEKTETRYHFNFNEIYELPIEEVSPSKENTLFYKDTSFENTKELSRSIIELGQLEPIVITTDKVIISGHRRHKACKGAGLETIKVRYFPKHSRENDFINFLREFNNQREKTLDERIKEELSKVTEEKAYQELHEYQERQSKTNNERVYSSNRVRGKLTEKKSEIVQAVVNALQDYSDYLPVTLRKIHYAIAEKYKPLKNTDKPDSIYLNDKQSYQELSKVVTKMRIAGVIEFDSIIDEQRTFIKQKSFMSIGDFLKDPLYGLQGILTGYDRNLMQSQEKHIEIFCEKEGLKPILSPILNKYNLPIQFTKGYQSISLCHETFQRFLRTGKGKGVILFLSDLDPEGEDIPKSILNNLRHDFDCYEIEVCKIGINNEHVIEYNLPENLEAKETSSRFNSFVEKHNSTSVYELDALEPKDLQTVLENAILNEIDYDLFEKELAKSKEDYYEIEKKRTAIFEVLKKNNL